MSAAQLLSMQLPRLCTATADWLACLVFLAVLPRRFTGVRMWASYLGGYAVLAGYLVLTDGCTGVWFNLFMAGSALLMLLFLMINCRLPLHKLIYYCARAFILAGFASSLMWQLYVWFALRNRVLRQYWALAMFMLGCYAVVFVISWFIEASHTPTESGPEVFPRTCLIVAVIALSIYILSSISYAPISTPFGGTGVMEVYNLRTIVYFAGLALLYALHLQVCDWQAQKEVLALQNMLHLQYENYKRSQESIDLVNRKYHDLKHQIALLRSQSGDERNAVLDQLEHEIKSYEAQNVTGNKVLDTVLTGKSLHCQNVGIQMTCVADGAALDFMDAMDISTLFGNALDNAIESVSKITDPERRLIHVAVSQQKGFLCLRFENCYDGALTLIGGRLRTTKQDARYHGFGLKSIEATAVKYGGSMTVDTANGWFTLRVLIPVR